MGTAFLLQVMTTKQLIELNETCRNAATESACEHIKFTAGNFPAWAKGHEAELGEVFKHYAQIGAREAVNYLQRNSII